MPPLQDPAVLARYKSALANWQVTGYVIWKETAQEWVRVHLGTLPLKDLAEMMYNHVESGGEIDRVLERRPEWNDRDYHYDLRLMIAGRLRYLETLLLDDDPEDSIVYVVSIHDA